MRRRTGGLWLGLAILAVGLLVPALAGAYTPPPIKHVFVIVDENESASVTFGPSSPAPYLSKTLVSEGAYLPNYYGIGHNSLDNYVAMVSGQAPNAMTSNDCQIFANFSVGSTMDADGQENGEGCVYPADVPTLMSQFGSAGLTWGAFEDGMGGTGTGDATDESRDNTVGTPPTCGHPVVGTADGTQSETATDQYATRHDPFVYFHSVIDNPAECANVVNLSELPNALASEATTPNYTFITPGLCDDGHDASCANGGPGGLAQADAFLKTWVPQIMASPAYQDNGLIMIVFDEAATSDASACCGETPGPGEPDPGGSGAGGGDTGAVLLSRYITPGTTSIVPYNHYAMLGSVEDLFGLSRIGYAAGTTAFGSDVFTDPSGVPAPTPTTPTPTTTSPTPTTTAPTPTETTPTPVVAPVRPQVSSLKLRPAAFRSQTGARAQRGTGTRITYRDSAAARATLVFARVKPGYTAGRGCRVLRPGQTRPKHTGHCVFATRVGTETHADRAGLNTIRFTGRVGAHPLTAGTYRLTVTPRLRGLTGKARIAIFTVK